MGYYKDSKGRTCFDPDSDEDTLYIEANDSIGFVYMLIVLKRHFGEDAEFAQFDISAENIHTSCIGLDYHDSMDYTNYIVITRK